MSFNAGHHAVVAFRIKKADIETARRHVAAAARDFGIDSLPTSLEAPSAEGWSAYGFESEGVLPAYAAWDLGRRLYEVGLGLFDAEVRVLCHVGSMDDRELYDLVGLVPPDTFCFTRAVAFWRTREELGAHGVFRAPEGALLGITPASEGAEQESLTRVSGWLPSIGRYLFPIRDDLEQRWEDLLDPHGLLSTAAMTWDASRVPDERHIRPAEELLETPGLLHVIAPARVGKSYLAKQLIKVWSETYGAFAELLSLEEGVGGFWRPSWWSEWERGQARALWVIDSVDEAFWQRLSITAVLRDLWSLSDEARARLTVILLQREDPSLEGLKLPEEPSKTYRLLPIDEGEALSKLSASGATDPAEALTRARSACDLLETRSLGALPDLLPILAEEGASLGRAELIERLTRVLVERALRPRDRSDLSIEQLIEDASRLAAIMLLSGRPRVAYEAGEEHVSWSEAFPGHTRLRDARSIERSGLLIAEPGGTSRFRERHLLEELAAHHLLRSQVWSPALRELMTDDKRGTLRGDLEGVARLLESRDEGYRSRLAEWRVADVQGALRRVAELAGPFAVYRMSEATLRRLDHPAVRESQEKILRDGDADLDFRLQVIVLGIRLRWTFLLESAVRIVLDQEEPARLRRYACELVCDAGNSKYVSKIRIVIGEISSDTNILQMKARVLRELLFEEPLLWIAERAPAPEQDLGDSRSALIYRIRERMDPQSAATILKGEVVLDPAVRRELVESAAMSIARDRPWSPDQARVLGEWMRGDEHMRNAGLRPELDVLLDQEIGENPKARELLYKALREHPALWHASVRLDVDEDLDWLLELDASEPSTSLTNDLLLLSLGRSESAGRLRRYLEEKYPEELAAKIEEVREARARARERAAKQEERRKRQEEREAAMPSLESVVQELFEASEDPARQLHWFSILCFHDPSSARRSGVVGAFDALRPELREKVFERTAEILRTLAPTPLPSATSYPATIAYEARAFEAVLEQRGIDWLDASLVNSWLPSVLFGSLKSRAEVATRCYEAEPQMTLEVAVRELRREASYRDYPSEAHDFPIMLWEQESLYQSAVKILRRKDVLPRFSSELVRLLAARRRGDSVKEREVVAIARELAEDENVSRKLRLACVDVALVLDSGQGFSRFSILPVGFEEAAEALHGLVERLAVLRGELGRWDDADLLELLRFLDSLGIRDKFPTEVHAVSDEERLSRLRDSVRIQLKRDERAEVDAQLEKLEPRSEISVSIKKTVDAIDGSRVLGYRNVQDLFYGLLAVLEEIAERAPLHRDLLRIRGKKEVKEVENSDWRHESALQAYIQVRLQDLLSPLRGGAVSPTILAREPTVEHSKEPDFMAFLPDGSSIPIEVKWSHRDVCVEELNKLGKLYVVNGNRTRGIYVVGFTGEGKHKSRAGLLAKLEEERDRFQRTHPTVKIGIVVLPFAEG